ncbi:MAG: chemotaxis protein CheW [Oxalobacter sp.]|nr:MAG: chemotaxis protein CheW [Oxalobacter sp.]
MQAARAQTDVRDNRLGVLIGQRRWLIDLQETGEVVPFNSLTKVPLTQSWYLGLLNIRGNLVSVIDFAIYQGLEPTETEPTNRVITFAPSLGINCGILVSRVFGLRNVSEMLALPTQSNKPASWVGDGFRDSESQQWTGLSLTAIAHDPRFLHIGT